MAARWHVLGVDAKVGRGAVLLGSLCLAAVSACGVGHVGNAADASPSTTAILQAASSFTLTVTPAQGPAGTAFHLHLVGATASDVVTFSIAAQGGKPYTGPTHSPGPDGSVSATYQSWPTDTAGLYVVLAHAASGKGAFATFRVLPAPPAPSSAP
jgi:hypothetical protein